ncbi:MAG: Ni/Fe-hydrogenase, b-type cytochrome subunit [Gemmatimonadota bacterium]|nr:Ni/Fe-hydrogenase, b-type cytochrome subunit [Gemmatimonadota bacterium]
MTTKTRPFSLGREVPSRIGQYKWVYLWGAPLRAMHWIAAFAVVVLILTGFYVGRPYFMVPGEGSPTNLMSWARQVHFLAAGVLVATAIIRMYWLLAGNRYERVGALLPGGRDLMRIPTVVGYYLLVVPEEKAPRYLGHNPLQQLSYTTMYALSVLMVVTGFAMYGQADPDGFFYWAFNWVGGVFGGMQYVRFAHHITTWAFILFILMHVYLSLRADGMEKTGTVSSIISGGRWVPADEKFVDEDE